MASGSGRAGAGASADSTLWAAMHTPEMRDPRGWIIPIDQPDHGTARKFIDALLEVGITVQHATAESRLLCILLIDVQRVRIADQARRQHKMRVGNCHSCAEFVAYFDLVIAFARKHRHAAHSQSA